MKIYRIASSVWDAENGIGATPNNMDVDYKGYRTYMTPAEFQNKVLPGVGNEESAEYLICLLYTSPSPRDGLLSRMPSSA